MINLAEDTPASPITFFFWSFLAYGRLQWNYYLTFFLPNKFRKFFDIAYGLSFDPSLRSQSSTVRFGKIRI